MRSTSSSGAPGTSGAAVVVAIVLAWTAPIAAAQAPPILTIDDASVVEGNAGTTTLAFGYRVNQPTSVAVTGAIDVIGLSGASFRPAIGGGACGGPGIDYQAQGGTVFILQPNPTTPPSGVATVTVCGDPYLEPDEHIFIRLFSVQGAQCFEGTCDGIGTIRNDGDTTPMPPSTFAVSDAAVTEPATGTKSVSFTVSLGSANPNRVEVDYRTIDGTARSTGPGTGPWTCPIIDYLSKTGRLVFQSGEVSKTVTTSICGGDSTSESNETFTLRLANPVGTTIVDPSGTATIRNFKLGF